MNYTADRTPVAAGLSLGSFSNDNSDGNENVKKAIGLLRKTTTLHAFLYILLLSLHNYDVPNCKFYGGRKQATTNLFSSWGQSSRNQLQENSPTLAIFSKLEWSRRRLKKREFILKQTFSLPLRSSMPKLPIKGWGPGIFHGCYECDPRLLL